MTETVAWLVREKLGADTDVSIRTLAREWTRRYQRYYRAAEYEDIDECSDVLVSAVIAALKNAGGALAPSTPVQSAAIAAYHNNRMSSWPGGSEIGHEIIHNIPWVTREGRL